MKQVYIFTDGACFGNPGAGGWGAILKYGDAVKELCGSDPNTTNNRMELTGVIQSLYALHEPCNVVLTTDSKYVVDGITKGWAAAWKSNGWRKADRKPAKMPTFGTNYYHCYVFTMSDSCGSKDMQGMWKTRGATSWQ